MSMFFTVVCPVAGVILSNFSLSASVLEMRLARRQGDLGSIYPVGLAMALVSSMSWCIYAVMVGDIYVLASVTLSAVVGIFSVTTAFDLIGASQSLALHRFGGQMEAILYVTTIVWLSIGYSTAISPDSGTPTFAAGMFCSTITCLFNMSPLFKLVDILRNRDASSINLVNNCINSVNSALWIAYGLFAINNPFVYLPSTFGILCSLLASVVKLSVPSGGDKKTDQDSTIESHGMSDRQAQSVDKDSTTIEGTEQSSPSDVVDIVIDRSTAMFEMVRARAETLIQTLEDTIWNIPVFEALLPADLRDLHDREKELLVAAELAAEKSDDNNSNHSDRLDPVREVYNRRFTVTDEDPFVRSRARSRSGSRSRSGTATSYTSEANQYNIGRRRGLSAEFEANQYIIGRRRGSSAAEYTALPVLPGVMEELVKEVEEEESTSEDEESKSPPLTTDTMDSAAELIRRRNNSSGNYP